MDQDIRQPGPLAPRSLARQAAADFMRSHMRQVVTIHHVMFDKLLSGDGDLPLEVAELLADAGRTYLRLSREVSATYLSCPVADIE